MKKGVSVVFFFNNSLRSAAALGLIMVAGASQAAPSLKAKVQADPATLATGLRLLAKRNEQFVENKGQWAKEARFLARSAGLNLWYTDHGIRYDQAGRGKRQAVDMFFVGGHAVRPVGVKQTNSRMDVYHGNVAARDIAAYQEVVARNVLPGVSMRGYFLGPKPRYDLVVAPGTKASSIKIGFHGANGISTERGSLKIATRLGGILNSAPIAYQTVGTHHVPVAARWVVSKAGTASFKLGAYDTSRPVVIDPATIAYGTYYGANAGTDEIRNAVKDPTDGSIILVGCTDAALFPGVIGSTTYTPSLNPEGLDAFVVRLSTTGSTTDYAALIGGSGDDVAQYVRIDTTHNNDVWIAGTTLTPTNGTNSFPSNITVNLGDDGYVVGGRDVIGADQTNQTNFFVARLTHNAATGTLDFGVDPIGVDNQGTLRYPAPSDPNSTQQPLPRYATVFGTNAQNPSAGETPSVSLSGFDLHGRGDGTVEFAFAGVLRAFATFRDTSSTGNVLDPALVPNDAAQAGSGHHTNSNFQEGFLVRFNNRIAPPFGNRAFEVSPNNSQYIESTNRFTTAQGVVLDASGHAYVAGTVLRPLSGELNTNTRNDETGFRTTPNAFFDATNPLIDGRFLRASDAYVRVYGPYIFPSTTEDPAVSRANLQYSTLVGGSGDDAAGGIAGSLSHTILYTGASFAVYKDSIYLAGTTFGSPTFPHTSNAFGSGFQPPSNTEQGVAADIFITRIDLTRTDGVTITGSTLAVAANLGVTSRIQSGFTDPTFQPFITSAEPAGMAVDKRGNVYITGNLRPYGVVFPIATSTETAAQISMHEPSDAGIATSIPISVDKMGLIGSSLDSNIAALDTAYDLHPTRSAGNGIGPISTTESFVSIFDPTLHNLAYSSYVGGPLDDMLYAPVIYGVDEPSQNDQLILAGWSVGAREYNIPRTTPADDYVAYGDMGTLISGGLKTSIDTLPASGTPEQSSSILALNPFSYGGYTIRGDAGAVQTNVNGVNTPDVFFAIDGFVSVLNAVPNPVINYTLLATYPSNPSFTTPTPTIGAKGAQRFSLGITDRNGNLYAQPYDTPLTVRVSATGQHEITITDDQGNPIPIVNNEITITIPTGQTSRSFTVTSNTYSPDLATIGFSVEQGNSPGAQLTIDPLVIASVTATTSPSPLFFGVSGGQLTVNVTLAYSPAVDTSFDVTVSNPTLLGTSTVIGTVTVPGSGPFGSGQVTSTTLSVPLNPTSAGSATITASLSTRNPSDLAIASKATTVTVSTLGIGSLTLSTNPSPLYVGSSGDIVTATINLGTAPGAPVTFDLTVSGDDAVKLGLATTNTVPVTVGTLTVAADSTSGTAQFSVSPALVGSATINAKLRGTSQTVSQTLNIVALPITSLSLTTSPSPLFVNTSGTVTATITLATAPGTAEKFALTTGSSILGTSGSLGTITVAAGSTTGTLTFTASPTASGTATIIATLLANSVPTNESVTATLEISAPSLISVKVVSTTGRPSKTTVRSGSTVTVMVTYNYGRALDMNSLPTPPSGLTFQVSPGAFTVMNLTKTVVSGNTATFSYVSTAVKRLTRSQDVSVKATDTTTGSFASGSITVLR